MMKMLHPAGLEGRVINISLPGSIYITLPVKPGKEKEVLAAAGTWFKLLGECERRWSEAGFAVVWDVHGLHAMTNEARASLQARRRCSKGQIPENTFEYSDCLEYEVFGETVGEVIKRIAEKTEYLLSAAKDFSSYMKQVREGWPFCWGKYWIEEKDTAKKTLLKLYIFPAEESYDLVHIVSTEFIQPEVVQNTAKVVYEEFWRDLKGWFREKFEDVDLNLECTLDASSYERGTVEVEVVLALPQNRRTIFKEILCVDNGNWMNSSSFVEDLKIFTAKIKSGYMSLTHDATV